MEEFAQQATQPQPSLVIAAGGGTGQAQMPPDSPAAASPSPDPDPEHVAEATDGSLAGRLRAKQAKLAKRTQEFGLPGWLDPDTGQYALVLVAKPISDRRRLEGGMTNEQLIVECTDAIKERRDDGELVAIEGGWAGVARGMGLPDDVTLGEVVRRVLGTVDESTGTVVEVPLRVDGLAEGLLAWQMGRRSAIEQVLGG